MRPSHLSEYLSYAIQNHYPVLMTGAPGIGKSDIGEEACKRENVNMILSHPVVADPTDYKGLPFPRKDGKVADFLPFGDLEKLINAKEETVFFLDDLGQAPTSVQAACMQLILARRINGHKISDKVTFFAATNRQQDKAGVTGIISPLKRRFIIQELEVNAKDWIKWAGKNGMPHELMAFIGFKQELLYTDDTTKGITNSPCPRTVAMVGKQQNSGCPQHLLEDACKGCVGEVFAKQYMAFLQLFNDLPSVDSVILNPSGAKIPPTPDTQYAFTVSLAKRMTDTTIGPICEYLDRLRKPELSVCCLKMAITRDGNLQNTRAFIQWAADKSDDLL